MKTTLKLIRYLSITGINRSTSIKALGVLISDKLLTTEHVSKILLSSSASSFALRTLKAHWNPTNNNYRFFYVNDLFRLSVVVGDEFIASILF